MTDCIITGSWSYVMDHNWIMELCPEIKKWQAEIIADHARSMVLSERAACADICDAEATIEGIAQKCAAAIRARNNHERHLETPA